MKCLFEKAFTTGKADKHPKNKTKQTIASFSLIKTNIIDL
ncbi:hypothetical protein M23134_03483 [Microscilla marina ATCC 23134]|uniref:Uncharacterized protein n=1 Tax=Microscilla marina ATCC 23134 TaxID=313606 RepID=A1ZN41_MICM2|nr:hypothetical protein M23134_03483 [Microscilla marina ATCC 23134]